ncbi:hypothetical protein M3Y97_01056000 [Aphelenchoides bicaudatus]|nr:hypothetical protein M3Y97_01056000 [Aphelenchoides bicaudatus]
MNATISPFYELKEATKNNPIQLADQSVTNDKSHDTTLNKVNEGKWITFGTTEGRVWSESVGYCNFEFIRTDFPAKPRSFMVQKNNPLIGRLNKFILEDSIYIRRIIDKYFYHTSPSNCKSPENERWNALGGLFKTICD